MYGLLDSSSYHIRIRGTYLSGQKKNTVVSLVRRWGSVRSPYPPKNYEYVSRLILEAPGNSFIYSGENVEHNEQKGNAGRWHRHELLYGTARQTMGSLTSGLYSTLYTCSSITAF